MIKKDKERRKEEKKKIDKFREEGLFEFIPRFQEKNKRFPTQSEIASELLRLTKKARKEILNID